MSEIRTLRDGDIDVLPRTVASAVQTADGSTVEDKINSAGNSSGKRTVRFTIGTSTNGWTEADCDYLCDGTDDQVEINNAIQALPTTGGEIKILDGTYNITAIIAMNKDNVKLSGNGAATILKRMWDSSSEEGVINITAINGQCCIENLQIDGNTTVYSSYKNMGIYVQNNNNNTITGNISNNNTSSSIYIQNSNNNTITGNTCNNNNHGIYLASSNNNTITGNVGNNNINNGIRLASSNNNTITGNVGNNSNIYLVFSSNNTITGNISNNNDSMSGILLFTNSNNNTITGNTYNNNGDYGIYLVSNNNNTITGNTCNNNDKGGIYISSSNNNNTITGNTCIRGTGLTSDYTSSQYTIYLKGSKNNYNFIANNNIMGKNYVSEGGTSNTFVNNKYN